MTAPARILCRPCSSGDHSENHGRIGCTVIVGRPPYDRTCECEAKRASLGPPSLEIFGEDEAEEVA